MLHSSTVTLKLKGWETFRSSLDKISRIPKETLSRSMTLVLKEAEWSKGIKLNTKWRFRVVMEKSPKRVIALKEVLMKQFTDGLVETSSEGIAKFWSYEILCVRMEKCHINNFQICSTKLREIHEANRNETQEFK